MKWLFSLLCCLFITALAGAAAPSVSTNSPQITAATESRFGKLYVSGFVRSAQASPAAHVDVALLDANDRVIAHQTEALRPAGRHPSLAEARRERYTVSFPFSKTHGVTRVRVSLHNHPHQTCAAN